MCGGFPNSTTSGKPPARQPLWEVLVELWRGGRWYDAISRPVRHGETK